MMPRSSFEYQYSEWGRPIIFPFPVRPMQSRPLDLASGERSDLLFVCVCVF